MRQLWIIMDGNYEYRKAGDEVHGQIEGAVYTPYHQRSRKGTLDLNCDRSPSPQPMFSQGRNDQDSSVRECGKDALLIPAA
jgi:hypothetical protein